MTTKQLLNTLYVQKQGTYLRLDHETVVLQHEEEEDFHVPLHHLGSIAVFGNVLISPYLLKKCAEDGRSISWFSRGGRYTGNLHGPVSGNVLLRRAQHEALSDGKRTLGIARSILDGKLRNSRYTLQRALRDGVRDKEPVEHAVDRIETLRDDLSEANDLDQLRGTEGNAASTYFACFDQLIRADDGDLVFVARNRRPPRDPINALLSFTYVLLKNECASALQGAGLDPQVGFLHALRPGRPALALDLMEEFRPILADRAVLTLVNRSQITAEDFEDRPGGAVNLTEDGRATLLEHWQKRKQQEVHHPAVDRRVPYGLLPHVQARLLARHLRGDVPEYVPFRPA